MVPLVALDVLIQREGSMSRYSLGIRGEIQAVVRSQSVSQLLDFARLRKDTFPRGLIGQLNPELELVPFGTGE